MVGAFGRLCVIPQEGTRQARKSPAEMGFSSGNLWSWAIATREKAAAWRRFIPKKASSKYYNVRDPREIQRQADSEVPAEEVYPIGRSVPILGSHRENPRVG
jgi:hypothetical protein